MRDGALQFAEPAVSIERSTAFGPFRLFPTQRLLLDGDKPVRLGSRALDILIALVEHPGELVSKEELMARVWPSTIVVEGNLTVHVAALRRALGDGHGGNRYLVNIPGRGYRFVAAVALAEQRGPSPARIPPARHRQNLPALLTRLVGRAEVVSSLVEQLSRHRFLSIVGPGGIGKTSVALAVAEKLIQVHEHGVWLVDLASVGDPHLVPTALATVLGLEIRSENPLPGLIADLRDKRMLLLLDNCEHVIDAAAALAVGILKGAPGVRVLATSREPLRAEGERVHRLSPLESPPVSARLTAAEALDFPAVQLFVERAAATLDEFELSDADAAIVAEICRKLDGIALAIEFAAGRLDVYGVRGLAARLEDRLRLLTSGRRAALPRHRTMSATLDWSYCLLGEAEQAVLRRLAVFSGDFTLRAAGAVAADMTHSEDQIIEQVTNLVTKSLVTADVSGAEPRLRLLDTTRAYAFEKLSESGESDTLGQRHATYYLTLLELAAQDKTAADGWPAIFVPEIDNIRAALAWAFWPGGDASIGARLGAASAPVWFEMSLLTECHDWTVRALGALDTEQVGTRQEMVLQATLGLSLMYTTGMTTDGHAALAKALDLAEKLDDFDYQQRILNGLWMYNLRRADFRGALSLARRLEALAQEFNDPAAMLTAYWTLGISLHFLGDQHQARGHLQRALGKQASWSQRTDIVRFGVDRPTSALSVLANTLWLQGFPDQAVQTGRRSIVEAQALEHPVSLCLALKWGGSAVSLRIGDLVSAESSITELIDHSERYSLHTDYACGIGLQGQLSVKRGDVLTGIRLLRSGLGGLHEAHFQVLYTEFLADLAGALAADGQVDEGLAAIGDALQRSDRSDELWYMPEVLRIKGEILLLQNRSNAAAAEDHFLRSLDWARRQGTLSWELRTAISLARLHKEQRLIERARDLLAPVYARFTEGFGTVDLLTAKRLLGELT